MDAVEYAAVTRPAPDGAIVDTLETEIDISDIVCNNCGADFEAEGIFCSQCQHPRGYRRATTLPYVAALKPQGLSSPPIPRIDPPSQPPVVSSQLPPLKPIPRVSAPYSGFDAANAVDETAPQPKKPKRLLVKRK